MVDCLSACQHLFLHPLLPLLLLLSLFPPFFFAYISRQNVDDVMKDRQPSTTVNNCIRKRNEIRSIVDTLSECLLRVCVCVLMANQSNDQIGFSFMFYERIRLCSNQQSKHPLLVPFYFSYFIFEVLFIQLRFFIPQFGKAIRDRNACTSISNVINTGFLGSDRRHVAE